MNSQSTISVVITTYNRKEYLKQALESVLEQKNANVEVIIIDDNSTDRTEQMINREFDLENIFYIKNKLNQGPEYGRTLGAKKALGKYIVFFDDDDYYIKDNLFERALNKFEEHPDLAFVSFNANQLDDKTNTIIDHQLNIDGYIDGKEYLEKFQWYYKKPLSTFTTIFLKEKLFPDKVAIEDSYMNDSSIYLQALLFGDAYIYPDPSGLYRLHEANITKNLNVAFVIKNLDSKANISKKMNALIEEQEKWLFKQVDLTLKYFLLNTPCHYEDFKLILEWLNIFDVKYRLFSYIKAILYYGYNYIKYK